MRIPRWTAAILALLLTGYTVPYLAPHGPGTWFVTPVFWLIFGLAVLAVLIGAVARWDTHADPGPATGRRPH